MWKRTGKPQNIHALYSKYRLKDFDAGVQFMIYTTTNYGNIKVEYSISRVGEPWNNKSCSYSKRIFKKEIQNSNYVRELYRLRKLRMVI